MHDRLFANQQTLEQWKPHADALGLDMARFEECMKSGSQAAKIRADMVEAQKAEVTGTPTFFLAYTDPKNSRVSTFTRLTGAVPFAAFKAAIDKALTMPPEAPKAKEEGK